MKKVLLIIASNGFQPLEYSQPKTILEKKGVEVITASDQVGVAVSAVEAMKTQVDLVLDDVKVEEYDGIFIMGGSGALKHLDNKKTYRIIREVADSGKVWGAICISPRILAHAGVLRQKKVTGWNDDGNLDQILSDAGAEYVREPVVVDDKLITGWGPNAAEEFGRVILKVVNS